VRNGERVGGRGSRRGREWEGRLDLDICPAAADFLVTPLAERHAGGPDTTHVGLRLRQWFCRVTVNPRSLRRTGRAVVERNPGMSYCPIFAGAPSEKPPDERRQ